MEREGREDVGGLDFIYIICVFYGDKMREKGKRENPWKRFPRGISNVKTAFVLIFMGQCKITC